MYPARSFALDCLQLFGLGGGERRVPYSGGWKNIQGLASQGSSRLYLLGALSLSMEIILNNLFEIDIHLFLIQAYPGVRIE